MKLKTSVGLGILTSDMEKISLCIFISFSKAYMLTRYFKLMYMI